MCCSIFISPKRLFRSSFLYLFFLVHFCFDQRNENTRAHNWKLYRNINNVVDAHWRRRNEALKHFLMPLIICFVEPTKTRCDVHDRVRFSSHTKMLNVFLLISWICLSLLVIKTSNVWIRHGPSLMMLISRLWRRRRHISWIANVDVRRRRERKRNFR